MGILTDVVKFRCEHGLAAAMMCDQAIVMLHLQQPVLWSCWYRFSQSLISKMILAVVYICI